MPTCYDCESDLDIDLDEVEEGDYVACCECGTEYEIVRLQPLELSRVDDEQESLELPPAIGEARTFSELMASIRGLSDIQKGERISEFFWRVEAPLWRGRGHTEKQINLAWVLFMRKGHGLD